MSYHVRHEVVRYLPVGGFPRGIDAKEWVKFDQSQCHPVQRWAPQKPCGVRTVFAQTPRVGSEVRRGVLASSGLEEAITRPEGIQEINSLARDGDSKSDYGTHKRPKDSPMYQCESGLEVMLDRMRTRTAKDGSRISLELLRRWTRFFAGALE